MVILMKPTMRKVRELKTQSGNAYHLKSPPYRLMLDHAKWAAIVGQAEVSSGILELAMRKAGDIEESIIAAALLDESQLALLDDNPLDAAEILSDIQRHSVSKKK